MGKTIINLFSRPSGDIIKTVIHNPDLGDFKPGERFVASSGFQILTGSLQLGATILYLNKRHDPSRVFKKNLLPGHYDEVKKALLEFKASGRAEVNLMESPPMAPQEEGLVSFDLYENDGVMFLSNTNLPLSIRGKTAFVAKNGLNILSSFMPEYSSERLYLNGTDKSKDGTWLSINGDNAEKVKEALQEYASAARLDLFWNKVFFETPIVKLSDNDFTIRYILKAKKP